MDKQLKIEAKKFVKNYLSIEDENISTDEIEDDVLYAFEMGAKSNYVEIKKLKFAIEQLKEIQGGSITPINVLIQNKINDLKEKIKKHVL